MLVVLSEVESPEGDTVAEREIVPEKPSRLTSLIMEVFEEAVNVGKVMLAGLAEMAKSFTLAITLTERDVEPDDAVTMMRYVPEAVELVVETVNGVAADPPLINVRLVGLRDAVGPGVGSEAVRVTLPVNPLRLCRSIAEKAEEPCWIVSAVGLATEEKSGPTVTETVVDWELGPLVPVTVTVYGPTAMFFFVETVIVAETLLPAVRVTLVGLIDVVGPVGDMDVPRVTVPAKVPRLVRVIVEVDIEELVARVR